jgi:hypothetical protein
MLLNIIKKILRIELSLKKTRIIVLELKPLEYLKRMGQWKLKQKNAVLLTKY